MVTKELNKGEIYIIRNKANGKGYVGQARKYVSINNNKWGTEARWKSHVSEAFSGTKDHCVLLNSAIRKYGSDGFEVTKICDCLLTEMDELEKKYIVEYNTLVPNGYNMTKGGQAKKTDSDATKQTKKDANAARGAHNEKTKERISKGQIGNRRNVKKRKHEEDADLPKYIVAIRKDGVVTDYTMKCFPIGINTKEYISKSFTVIGNDREKAKQEAIAYLEELKEKYKYVEETVKQNKLENEKKLAVDKRIEKHNASIDSEYIKVIVEDSKILGYAVEGLVDKDGNPISRREFTDKTNRWNLDRAHKYVSDVKKLIDGGAQEDWTNMKPSKRNNAHDEKLPPFIKPIFDQGELRGYKVASFPLKTETGVTKVTIPFTQRKYSLKENKEAAHVYVLDLMKQNDEFDAKHPVQPPVEPTEPPPPTDLNDIYLVRNKQNGKAYIGSVKQYLYNETKPYGWEKQWKRNLKEYNKEDTKNSPKLYEAMRESGPDAFEIVKLAECTDADAKQMRVDYIKEYDSIFPNGYNLRDGSGNISEETLKKMTGNKKITDEFKKRVSNIHLGRRDDKQVRKHPEDNDLPKYITAKRKDGKIIGYQVLKFPIGKTKAEYINKLFKNLHDPKKGLESALAYLEELKHKYLNDDNSFKTNEDS
jgi:hypothetical protein